MSTYWVLNECQHPAHLAGDLFAGDVADLRPGKRSEDADLVGIPHRIVAGARGFSSNEIEYKRRGTDEVETLAWSVEALQKRIGA